jgi:hypothetical protein
MVVSRKSSNILTAAFRTVQSFDRSLRVQIKSQISLNMKIFSKGSLRFYFENSVLFNLLCQRENCVGQ